MNYDEESENEMIKSADLADLKPLVEDESKYRALHSHVKYYNERNTEDRKRLSNVFPYLRPYAKETFDFEQEEKPFIAGFKHELDKVRVLLLFKKIFNTNSL
ncbi:uncharacterized protein LOC116841265 [Odontomachus brunneus]|uniref:uncharacterized protein LOC116841265 n=1 Tax=Odontomachus brunneus TaxID=486640 RepID=UPI0013F25B00|nr:uncharacterized protein LOC116841265 [Odontomachus brunneus]